MYTPTPDYYRDYIQHGMQYSEEDTLTHYGVKGMKWRKRKKMRNKANSKILDAELNRKSKDWDARVFYDTYEKAIKTKTDRQLGLGGAPSKDLVKREKEARRRLDAENNLDYSHRRKKK